MLYYEKIHLTTSTKTQLRAWEHIGSKIQQTDWLARTNQNAPFSIPTSKCCGYINPNCQKVPWWIRIELNTLLFHLQIVENSNWRESWRFETAVLLKTTNCLLFWSYTISTISAQPQKCFNGKMALDTKSAFSTANFQRATTNIV